MSAIYNLFLRQWKRGDAHCSVADLDEAVEKKLLTAEQAEQIKNTVR